MSSRSARETSHLAGEERTCAREPGDPAREESDLSRDERVRAREPGGSAREEHLLSREERTRVREPGDSAREEHDLSREERHLAREPNGPSGDRDQRNDLPPLSRRPTGRLYSGGRLRGQRDVSASASLQRLA